MVCVPCIVVPVMLWVFHKFIQPLILKYFPGLAARWPWGSKSVVSDEVKFTEEVLKSSEGQFIKEKIDNNPVTIFSKTTCNFCKMAKKKLNELNVNYDVHEIDGRDDMKEIQDCFEKLTGGRTVPRIFVGVKCIGGASEMLTLNNQGKLIPLIEEAGGTFKEKST